MSAHGLAAGWSTMRRTLRGARVHLPLLIPMLLVVSVYHAWLVPGLITGVDFVRPDPAVLTTFFPWPPRWADADYTGYSTVYWSPAAPIWALAGALARLGMSWDGVERILWLFPLLVLAVLGPYALAYRLTRFPIACAAAASFFAVNTWTIGLTERGHIPSLVAYALMPVVLLALLTLRERPSPARSLRVAALTTLQAMYDIRYTYITVIFMALFALSRWRSFDRLRLAPVAWQSFNILLMWTVLNFFWLAPLLFYPIELPPEYTQVSGFIGQSAFENLPHAAAVFFPFYHFATAADGFLIDRVESAFYFVPILVAASIALGWRRHWTPSLAFVIAVGVVILAGPNTVVGAFDRFLFVYVPGMFIFRDISKFSSLVACAYSMALALGIARLAALARLRGLRPAKPAAVAALAVGVAAYAGLMHDAYNPKRLSNFAPLQAQAQDIRLKRFLDTQTGYFRTAFYPTARPYFIGSDHHPVLYIGEIANSPAFRGLAFLSPQVSDPWALWRSPLMPAVMRQMNIRYFVIYDDPTGWAYRAFSYNVQRAETKEFFSRLPWLRKAAHFGNNVVYEIVAASAAPAFIAPTPVLYDGTAKALDALAGTALWSDHGAVIFASQVDKLGVLHFVHSVVRGPDAFDPRRPELCPECDEAERTAAQYSAVALTRESRLATMFGPPAVEQFKFRIRSSSGGPASLRLAIGRNRYYLGSYTNGRLADSPADEIFSLGSNDERIDFDDPNFAPWRMPTPGPGIWFAMRGGYAALGAINPSPWPEVADLVFPGVVSPDEVSRRVRFALVQYPGGQRRDVRELIALPRFVATLAGGGPWVTLRDIVLRPGVTWVDVRVTDTRSRARSGTDQPISLLLRADVKIANERFDRAYGPRRGVATSVAGVGGIDISLAQHPRLWLHFRSPSATPVRLVLTIENRQTHERHRVDRILRLQDQLNGTDVAKIVQSALDTMSSLDPNRYGAPLAAWLGDSVKGPLESTAFKIRDAWVESLDQQRVAARPPRVTEFVVGIGPPDVPPWLPYRPLRGSDASSLTGVPLVAIDGKAYASTNVAYDKSLDRIVARLHLRLASDSHLIEACSETSFGIQSALLSEGTLPRPADAAIVRNYREITSTEYAGTLETHGGLLVWPVTYDDAWNVAIEPSDGPKATGNTIVDWWRMRKYFVGADRHLPVNTLFNGWFVPRTNGRVVFLYVADAISRIAAIVWALLSLGVIGFVLRRQPRQRRQK